MDPLRVELVDFQVERLRQTYRDFLENPDYRLLTKFFFEDVYSAQDKSARDASVRKLHAKVRDALGDEPVRRLEKVIELNEMTDRLDDAILEQFAKLGVRRGFTESEYEEAYYLCDNYEERDRQIGLILESLRYFHGLARYRTIGMGLTLLRPYAIVKRATGLLDFLQGGYRAFRSVASLDEFHDAIQTRETERLDRIYSLGRKVPSVRELRKRAREMGIRDAETMELRRLMRAMAQWA